MVNYWAVVRYDGDKKEAVCRAEDIKDFYPKHSKDFQQDKSYECLWEEPTGSFDGYYPAHVLCLAETLAELKSKVKRVPSNFNSVLEQEELAQRECSGASNGNDCEQSKTKVKVESESSSSGKSTRSSRSSASSSQNVRKSSKSKSDRSSDRSLKPKKKSTHQKSATSNRMMDTVREVSLFKKELSPLEKKEQEIASLKAEKEEEIANLKAHLLKMQAQLNENQHPSTEKSGNEECGLKDSMQSHDAIEADQSTDITLPSTSGQSVKRKLPFSETTAFKPSCSSPVSAKASKGSDSPDISLCSSPASPSGDFSASNSSSGSSTEDNDDLYDGQYKPNESSDSNSDPDSPKKPKVEHNSKAKSNASDQSSSEMELSASVKTPIIKKDKTGRWPIPSNALNRDAIAERVLKDLSGEKPLPEASDNKVDIGNGITLKKSAWSVIKTQKKPTLFVKKLAQSHYSQEGLACRTVGMPKQKINKKQATPIKLETLIGAHRAFYMHINKNVKETDFPRIDKDGEASIRQKMQDEGRSKKSPGSGAE